MNLNLNKKISEFALQSFPYRNKPVYFLSNMKSIKHIDHVSNNLIVKNLVSDPKQYVVVFSSVNELTKIKKKMNHPYFINELEFNTFVSYCKKNNYHIILYDSHLYKIDPFIEHVETYKL